MDKRAATVAVGFVLAVATACANEPEPRGPVPTRDGPILRVAIEPYPEGAGDIAFALDPAARELPIERILRFVPRPLPRYVDQGADCEFGANVTIAFNGGARVSYGPCRYPASIKRLWEHIQLIHSDGACAPDCGPIE